MEHALTLELDEQRAKCKALESMVSDLKATRPRSSSMDEDEISVLIRKYKKYKNGNESKSTFYLQKLVKLNTETIDRINAQNKVFCDEIGFEDNLEKRLFEGFFIGICRLFWWIRVCSITINIFDSETADIRSLSIPLNDEAFESVWRSIYDSKMDFIGIQSENGQFGTYSLVDGVESFCTKSSEFMAACYQVTGCVMMLRHV